MDADRRSSYSLEEFKKSDFLVDYSFNQRKRVAFYHDLIGVTRLPARPRWRVKAGAMMKINTWLSSFSFPLYGTGLACPSTGQPQGIAPVSVVQFPHPLGPACGGEVEGEGTIRLIFNNFNDLTFSHSTGMVQWGSRKNHFISTRFLFSLKSYLNAHCGFLRNPIFSRFMNPHAVKSLSRSEQPKRPAAFERVIGTETMNIDFHNFGNCSI
jgi:hypothetical protein